MVLLAGFAQAASTLLLLAGVAKLVRLCRPDAPASAIQQLLKLKQGTWRRLQAAGAIAEILVGVVTLTSESDMGPVFTVILGAAFLGLLVAVERRNIRGDCGCFGGLVRRDAGQGKGAAAFVATSGAVLLAMPQHAARANLSFEFGWALGAAVLAALSLTPAGAAGELWRHRTMRGARRSLLAHPVFGSVSRSLGETLQPQSERRELDQRVFTYVAMRTQRVIEFRVERGSVTNIHASVLPRTRPTAMTSGL